MNTRSSFQDANFTLELAYRKSFNFQIERFVRRVLPDYGPDAYLKVCFNLYPDKTLFNPEKTYIIVITETSYMQTPATLKMSGTNCENVNLGTAMYRPLRTQLASIKYSLIDDLIVRQTESQDAIILHIVNKSY
ncbi:hypothetical protein QTN25_005366 [Entamoeba marina]